MRYKMILSDFDGTLRDDSYQVSERVRDAIARYVDQGGVFIIVTGRMRSSILAIARKLGLKGLVASYQGATVTEIESGKDLILGGMTDAQALKLLAECERLGLHTHAYCNDELYSNYDDEALRFYERACNVKGKVEADLCSLVAEQNFTVQKALCIVAPEKRDGLIEYFRQFLNGELAVTYSTDFFIEFSSMQYTKGTVVDYLADYYGVKHSEIIAVGDSFNDAPMLCSAGLGVAVKNADRRLKEVAALNLAYTNNEDAVARLIDEIALA